jgi:hypothetical protein
LNWCTRFCRPLRNHSATWPHGPGSIYSITRLGNRPSDKAHCAASMGGWFAGGVELNCVRSVCCPGGSRACAMLTRQPCCDVEIVPSLHSNLAGAASAAGAGFSSAAACWGAGASAAGFSDKAQPAHQGKISTAMPIRIRVASGSLQRPMRMVLCRDQPAACEFPQHTTAGHDSNIDGLSARIQTENRKTGAPPHSNISWIAAII